MASRDVEMPAVTYLMYLVGVAIPGSVCACVDWKPRFTLPWKGKEQ